MTRSDSHLPPATSAAPSSSGAIHVLVLVEPLPYPFDTRVRAQVRALTSHGYHVTVVCPTGVGFEALEDNVDGAAVRRFRVPRGGRGGLGYLREYGLALLRMALIVRQIRKQQQIDVCLVCNPPDLLMALALPLARRGSHIVFDFREIAPELFEAKFGRRGLLHRLLLYSERFAFRHADVVLTVSSACEKIARTRGGIDPSRVLIVGNGPEAERIFPVPPRPELRRGYTYLVLWLGAMSRQEGLQRLIDAADHLVNVVGRKDVAFAIVGPGDVHDDLRADIERRDLEQVVHLSGPVGDELVRAYMATADVCVGVDESNSMNDRAAMRKVLEYMAMGRAVVQFPLLEMQRLCGDTTLYARNADSHDLAEQIDHLLDDYELRASLGARARERVFDGLMWHDQVPQLLAAMEMACEHS